MEYHPKRKTGQYPPLLNHTQDGNQTNQTSIFISLDLYLLILLPSDVFEKNVNKNLNKVKILRVYKILGVLTSAF